MELSFNHFKNVQDVDCYLCNPDRSLLSVIPARARNFILRFNTLSEFTCEVPKYVINAKGDLYEHPYYDYIQTRRLINVDKIGWFKIVEAVETENGNGTSKSVRAESCESTFKEVGFAIENRVYKFYDELDEEDESYNPLNEEAMPSVVGQLYKQLGICCDLSVGDITPTVDYRDWTIIWIEPMLKYGHTVTDEEGNTIEYKTCRTLNENVESFGYDFMTSDVSQAFQVFFEFDFAHHAIKVKSTSKVAEKTDIYLSFDNVMKELSTTENSQDIVTVLTCEGTNLGINSVNPMGTNYICDFSYYMGNKEKGYPWMSQALTDKIEAWKDKVSDNEDSYAELVEKLQELYEKKTALESKKTLIDKELLVIKKAADDYAANSYLATSPVDVENVETGEKSLASDSVYYTQEFNPEGERKFKIYKKAPVYTAIYDEDGEKIDSNYVFADEDYLYEVNKLSELSFEDEIKETDEPSLYFMDGDNRSYCKIIYGLEVQDASTVLYSIKGFVRYAPYCNAGVWQSIRETEQRTIDADIETEQTAIDAKLAEMKAISDQCNILNFFSDNTTLLKELRCYWVDGKYTNDTLKGLDGDTVAENLSLSKELMDAGKIELARVAQPRFSFTVTSANFLKMPQFAKFAEQLAMGKVVTVEKNEDTRYNASLTEMSFSLDESDTFSLTFSNSLKLTDWGFTYADLFKSVSDTSRAVQANWTNLMEYSQEKETISNLLINSLDRTLRAGLDNAYNQEFIVDTSGILGRKFKNDNTAYENEQLRIINNVIMFTDDNWQTASAALGKVTYVDPMDSSKSITKYGLVAEAIVGKLLMGENLYIGDGDGYVTIDSNGIKIYDKNDKEKTKPIFVASKEGLSFTGYATTDQLEANSKFLADFLGEYSGTLAEFEEGLQSQIDSKAETWHQNSDPSTSWNSDEKTAHDGDLWFCTAEIKDEDGTTVLFRENATYLWNGTSWVEQEAPKAVFDAIDGKAQIFVNDPKSTTAPKPQPPFNIGDLWVQGGSGDILRCKQKNESTSDYTISDYWESASKYTDDTTANKALEVTTEFSIDKVNNLIKMASKTLYLHSNQFIIDTDNLKFNVDGDGKLEITGSVIATGGEIGGFSIDDNNLVVTNENKTKTFSILQNDDEYDFCLKAVSDYRSNNGICVSSAVFPGGISIKSIWGDGSVADTVLHTVAYPMIELREFENESVRSLSVSSVGSLVKQGTLECDNDRGIVYTTTSEALCIEDKESYFGMQHCFGSDYFSGMIPSIGKSKDYQGNAIPLDTTLTFVGSKVECIDKLPETRLTPKVYAPLYVGEVYSNKHKIGGISETEELKDDTSRWSWNKIFLGDAVIISLRYNNTISGDNKVSINLSTLGVSSVYSVTATAIETESASSYHGPVLTYVDGKKIYFYNDDGQIDGVYATIIGK